MSYFSFGQIARRVVGAIAKDRPPRDTLQVIDGGDAAAHLAQRPPDWKEGAIGDDELWHAQVKVDGIRCLYIDGRLVTLEGQCLDAANHTLEALRQLEEVYGMPMFFDGEFVEDDGFEATVAAFKKGEGHGTLWLFDAVPLHEWKRDECSATWEQRKAQLLANHRVLGCQFVGALKSRKVRGEAEALLYFESVRAHNHEGIVLKRPDSLYRRQRNRDWLRMKGEDYTDMVLIDVLGTDKGGARKLVLRDPEGSGPVIITTGFASMRHVIWTNRELFLGDDDCPAIMVEVKHNGRTGHGKPRHATFSKLRQDKMRRTADA